jgi:hypothetical protein
MSQRNDVDETHHAGISGDKLLSECSASHHGRHASWNALYRSQGLVEVNMVGIRFESVVTSILESRQMIEPVTMNVE